MFTVALFTIARTWKQPKCPSTDKWIKKMWHIYTMEHDSAIKRNEIELFLVRWMDSCLECGVQHWRLLLVEWSWVLALRQRCLGECSLIDTTWGWDSLWWVGVLENRRRLQSNVCRHQRGDFHTALQVHLPL